MFILLCTCMYNFIFQTFQLLHINKMHSNKKVLYYTILHSIRNQRITYHKIQSDARHNRPGKNTTVQELSLVQ